MKNYFTFLFFISLMASANISYAACDASDASELSTCAGGGDSDINITANITSGTILDFSGKILDLSTFNLDLNAFSIINATTSFQGDAAVGGALIIGSTTIRDAANPGAKDFTFAQLNTAIANCGCTTLAAAITFLPVELLDFSGKISDNMATLNWSTASESSNDYFLVEHSFDGRSFTEAGRVNGQGDATAINEYKWQSAALSGTSYYRLSQYDFDGTFAVLGVVSLQNKKDYQLEINPNPSFAGSKLTLAFDAEIAVKNIQLVGLNGQKWGLAYTVGDNSLDLPVSLPSGMYWLRIQANQEVIVKPIFIIE